MTFMTESRTPISNSVISTGGREAVLRGVIVLNLVLVALSWWPWFEGTADKPGVVDHLLGSIRFGGFRVDVLWLVASTFLVFFALIASLFNARKNRSAQINATLCAIEIFAFCSFVYRIATSGLLDFG
jgi:hypothetical protein